MQKTITNLSSQSKLLISLLFVSFSLMCMLGWQAYNAVAQQRMVAQKVLLEFAQLAAEEYSRRIMSDIGYQGYFRDLGLWREKLDALTDKENALTTLTSLTTVTTLTECGGLAPDSIASFYFVSQNNQIEFSAHDCHSPSIYSLIGDLVGLFEPQANDKTPFSVIHTSYNRHPISLVIGLKNQQYYGFLVNREKLAQKLTESLQKAPLLPKALANGKATNEMIDLSMFDHLNYLLIKPKLLYPSDLIASKTLTTEYSGIFKRYRIEVSINPESVDKLIIGGLPTNNLPLVILTLLVTIFVFVISLLQIRKEKNLNRLRENFIAEVSHELRTPLTQIRMFSEMLFNKKGRNESETIKYAEIIHRESLRLNHLIDNILKYSQSKQPEINPIDLPLESQDIAVAVANAIEEFEPLAKQKNSHIESHLLSYQIPIEIYSVKRILINLLDNAIKYGPENQQVTVDSKLDKQNLFYQIIITDQGPGIPPDEIENIWQPYYRLPIEKHRAIAGTGIGLYLVKQLAEKNNAVVWCESNHNNKGLNTGDQSGCRFILQWSIEKIERGPSK